MEQKVDSVALGMKSFPLVTKEAEEGAEAKEKATEVVAAAPLTSTSDLKRLQRISDIYSFKI